MKEILDAAQKFDVKEYQKERAWILWIFGEDKARGVIKLGTYNLF